MMSEPIKDGGPAFSRSASGSGGDYDTGADGMSLRDYFAGQALAGLLVKWNPSHRCSDAELAMGERGAAIGAYRLADAMLKARDFSS